MIRKIVFFALAGLIAMGSLAYAQSGSDGVEQGNQLKKKQFQITRKIPKEAKACIQCHKEENPGLFADWANSEHAKSNITCLDCHLAEEHDPGVSEDHYEQYEKANDKWGSQEYRVPVSTIVSPKDCSRCHPAEAEQYSKSKHANTLEIIWKVDPWLNDGMNTDFERSSGCYKCHGSVVQVTEDGDFKEGTWPNVGVGRINPDGSKGSCTSCHTRHRFSVAEARKPDSCGQCHLGPDHPQKEIYHESKHGYITQAYEEEYNWDAAPGTWTPGVDYRAPTCASCHMSGSGGVKTTHDVTERLSWETQAPLTVRPSEFSPFPADTNWRTEREKMKKVCMQCHSERWTDNHYRELDKAVELYNEEYFKPAKAKLDTLYEKDLLDDSKFFDERLEVLFYELWHHEGRRARMGAAMMGPDYTWWHGFYKLKHNYNKFMTKANKLLETGEKAHRYEDFPGDTGNTTKPKEIFGPEAK